MQEQYGQQNRSFALFVLASTLGKLEAAHLEAKNGMEMQPATEAGKRNEAMDYRPAIRLRRSSSACCVLQNERNGATCYHRAP